MGNTYGHLTLTDETQEFVDWVNETADLQLLPEVRDGLLVGWDVSTESATRIYLNNTDPKQAVRRFAQETDTGLGKVDDSVSTEELLALFASDTEN